MFIPRSLVHWLCLLSIVTLGGSSETYAPPVQLTDEQDHQRTLNLLQISELRRGPDGDPKSPNAANFDESKVPAKLNLPDPVVSNSGKRVTSPEMWWTLRRAGNCGDVRS